MADREDVLFQAKLAEQAERYDEMAETMKKVIRMGANLTVEERNLLSVAYKNSVGARRSAWRVMSTAVQLEQQVKSDNTIKIGVINDYRVDVEKELKDICSDILTVINDHLLPSAAENQAKVFYYKMRGDYQRYLAEISAGDEHKAATDESFTAYKAATELAEVELPPTHPVRLGLALNLSVFYYEILQSPNKACQVAESAFSNAIRDLNTLTTSLYKDSSLIMQLLQDNLSLWKPDCSEENK